MENKLKNLFESQNFFQNKKLQSVIDDVQDRYYGGSLDLDDLELVSAAGIPDAAVLRNHMDSDKKDIKE